MRKRQYNIFFREDVKRNNKIARKLCLVILFFVLFVSFLALYFDRTKVKYISYSEVGNVDYRVKLTDNDFFENEYLGKNNQYISSLIDDIEARFNYRLSFQDSDVEYKYSYRIVATVKVIDKTTKKSLYTKEEILLPDKEAVESLQNTNLSENVTIDYHKYNDLIKSFISIYDVGNIESNLVVSMYVNVIGSCGNFDNESNNQSVMSLNIPLTVNTMDISISNDLLETSDNIILCQHDKGLSVLFLMIAVIVFIIDFCLVIKLIVYIRRSRSSKSLYKIELRKILRNYKQYIQKVEESFDYSKYQIVRLGTFVDLLEIRDTVVKPILMIENSEKTKTDFLIINDNLLYIYSVKINHIKTK